MNFPPSESSSRSQPDERVMLFPSLAYFDTRRGQWKAIIQGRIYDASRVPISTRILLKGLKRALKATEDELAGEIFRQRIQGFTAKPISGRRVRIEFGGQHFALRQKSKRNGAFFGIIKIPEGLVPPPQGPEQSLAEPLQIRLHLGSPKRPVESAAALPEGTIHLIAPRGVSVVSDIDDTIKATEVTSRHSMLANTFLRPFAAIDGMAEVYRQWQEAGASFHYVSSSPWQLFQPLAELCQLSRFPDGSMHLRYFRIRDEMFKRWRPGHRKGKAAIIAGLMKKLPHRHFVLVGDSGERDPEIYRFLARRFPDQVSAILIRQLVAKPLNARRIEKLNEVPPGVRVRLFESAAELQDFQERLAGRLSP